MNKYRLCIVLSIVTLFFIFLSPLSAQENPPDNSTPTTSSEDGTAASETGSGEEPTWALFTFEQLNFGNEVLEQPNFSKSYTLHIPAHWALVEGSGLNLELQPFVRQNGLVVNENVFGGMVIVKFEGVVLAEQAIISNEKFVLDLRIPKELLEDDGRGSYSLEISLVTDFSCGSLNSSSLQILEASYFSIAYQEVLPITDLRQLPFPIQQNSFLPNVGTFVIPDTLSEEDAIGLLTAAAGMGRMSNRTSFNLVSESDLTDELKATSHLIFVGHYDDFVSTEKIFGSEERSLLESAGEDDGILKLTNSPWERSKVILHVSGKSSTGIEKAANALMYGVIRPATDRFDFAIIEEVVLEDELLKTSFSPAFSFADLGHDIRTLYGPNEAEMTFSFEIPRERPFTLEENGNISLIFNHSDLLDYEASGINLFLNNRPIGSSHFSKETTHLTTLPVEVPQGLLRSGVNTLSIQANLAPLTNCSNFADDGTWVNIFPTSSVSLPITFVDDPVDKITPFIRTYPRPFSLSNDLGNTTFIVPKNNHNALFSALQIAFDLGKQVSGDVLQMDVVFSENVSDDTLNQRHLIVVGQATNNAFIDTINSWLPGPFAEDSNLIVSDRLPVEYRLPANESLGYLQLIPSPWNTELFILLISGSNDVGVQNATSILLNNRRALNGDLAVIDQNGTFTTVTPNEIVAEAEESDEASSEETAVAIEVEKPEPSEIVEEVETEDVTTEGEISKESDEEAEAEAPSDDDEAAVPVEEDEADSETAVSENEPEPATNAPQRASRGANQFTINAIPRLPLMVLGFGTLALCMMGAFYLYNRIFRSH